jgi:transposase
MAYARSENRAEKVNHTGQKKVCLEVHKAALLSQNMHFLWYNIYVITEEEFKDKYKTLNADQMLDAMYQMYLANSSLSEQLSSINRRVYGSKSEHVSPDQLTLFNEAELTDENSSDDEKKEPELPSGNKGGKGGGHKGKRKDSMRNLPVRRKDLYPDGDTSGMNELKPEVIRVLRYQRAEYYIDEIVCHKYVAKEPNEDGSTRILEVDKSRKPVRLMENSRVSAEIPSHWAYQKFIMGIPFTRIEKDLNTKGILFSRQFICSVVLRLGDFYLEPMIHRMEQDLRSAHVLNMDETELEVLENKRKEDRQTSYIWGALTGVFEKKQMALFYYNKTREHDFLKTILGEDYHGIIQSDGYQAYEKYKAAQMKVGCMAHGRRKFFDALTTDPKLYKSFNKASRKKQEEILKEYPRFADIFKMVALMDQLFAIERKLKEKHAQPDEIKKVRNEKARPIMEQIHAHNQHLKDTYLQTGKLGKAVTYLKNQWEYLMNYLKDGEVALSNNLAEREGMKPIVIARKNFLFADTENGARISMYYFSLLISAKLNHLNPEKYLTYVFTELSTNGLKNDVIERILPYSNKLPEELRVKKS